MKKILLALVASSSLSGCFQITEEEAATHGGQWLACHNAKVLKLSEDYYALLELHVASDNFGELQDALFKSESITKIKLKRDTFSLEDCAASKQQIGRYLDAL